MLAQQKLLTADECQQIKQTLGDIRREIDEGRFPFREELEAFIEAHRDEAVGGVIGPADYLATTRFMKTRKGGTQNEPLPSSTISLCMKMNRGRLSECGALVFTTVRVKQMAHSKGNAAY